MRSRVVGLVMLVVIAGCGGAAPTEESATSATIESEPASEPDIGVAGTHVGETDEVGVGVDLTGPASDLAADARALRRAVDAPPMTFVVARIDNRSDEPATLEEIEVADDAGDVLVLAPPADLVRDLRSEVDLYDTETFDRATQLLDSIEQLDQTAGPGETTELLLGAEGRLTSIASVSAVGSFGRLPLRER